MGVQQIQGVARGAALREFTAELLRDLAALEDLIASGRIESGVRRLGAEQEVFLVDRAWRAVPAIAAVRARLDEPWFVPELGQFQAEINLDPIGVGPRCLADLHAQLDARLARLRAAVESVGGAVVLTGILPTLRRRDVAMENVTEGPRYHALDDAIRRMRGASPREFHIEGTDELIVRDATIMFEAATASFQVHLQVTAEEFAAMYNAAQAVAGVQLAAAAGSPLLFGRRLWHETRVPLFQQAADTRAPSHDPTSRAPRVTFGTRWVRESPVEVFREDVARFPVLLVAPGDEDPRDAMARGRAPRLDALRVHTGTVYRWNRACYGTLDGRAHLRIENRVLPAGPSTLDEVANAALWIGMVAGVARAYGDIGRRFPFDEARTNFVAAARHGLGAHLAWVDGWWGPARELLLERMIPLAREGLRELGVARDDARHYLGVVRERVDTGRTAARWLLASDAAVRTGGSRGEQMAALTAATVARQWSGQPVHAWPLARLAEAGGPAVVWTEVEQVMTTDVATVRDEDAIALAESVMRWQGVDAVPVEDARGELVGVVTRRALAPAGRNAGPTAPVRAVMEHEFVGVPLGASTHDALAAMHARGTDAVFVVDRGKLVGVVTAATLAASATRGR